MLIKNSWSLFLVLQFARVTHHPHLLPPPPLNPSSTSPSSQNYRAILLALQSDKVHKSEWARLGLWHPRPKYSDGVYISSKCTPTPGERKLFRAQNHDDSITVRKAVAKLAKAKDSFLSDKTMHQYMRVSWWLVPEAAAVVVAVLVVVVTPPAAPVATSTQDL